MSDRLIQAGVNFKFAKCHILSNMYFMKKFLTKRILIIGGLTIVVIALIGGVFYFGYSFGFKKELKNPKL